jgi:hypothetical protein
MDQDLQELLALWLSNPDLHPERREAPLACLRNDAFRGAVVAQANLPSPSAFDQPSLVGLRDRNPEGVP